MTSPVQLEGWHSLPGLLKLILDGNSKLTFRVLHVRRGNSEVTLTRGDGQKKGSVKGTRVGTIKYQPEKQNKTTPPTQVRNKSSR